MVCNSGHGFNSELKVHYSRYCDKISVYGEHLKAGQNKQPFNEINKVMCNM